MKGWIILSAVLSESENMVIMNYNTAITIIVNKQENDCGVPWQTITLDNDEPDYWLIVYATIFRKKYIAFSIAVLKL